MKKRSLEEFDIQSWNERFSKALQNQATAALENGKILYFPQLNFDLQEGESALLTPTIVSPKSKNISYNLATDCLGGFQCIPEQQKVLHAMMKRYAEASGKFLLSLIPHYQKTIVQAKTSFRPVEIFGRKSSYRKDDTRLHIDSFPSNPVQGKRILRLFTNINPDGKSRVWRSGEDFHELVNKLAPRINPPPFGVARFLNLFGITKSLRSPYDHYMMKIHDEMKRDMQYQKEVFQEELAFLPGSSWAVFTDQVSHAAMSGQHVFEQTFYLPAAGLKDPSTSPLAVLERYFQKQLV